MHKIRFDGNGKCLGPCILCEQCDQPIEDSEIETSLFTWRKPVDMTGVRYVSAVCLHQDCIIAYAKRDKKPYGVWNGVRISDLAGKDITIYAIDPEQLEIEE